MPPVTRSADSTNRKVVIADPLSPVAREHLEAAGCRVVELEPGSARLAEECRDAVALIVRSGTQVDRELLDGCEELVVVGRAGVGVDNIDVEAASENGVVVVNAPQSNVVSAAEHTMALLLALVRNVAPAHRSLLDGDWNRSAFRGTELAGKTLGVIGMGRIGRAVAQRALAFGMAVLGHDPYVDPATADLPSGVGLVDLDSLAAAADVITLHVAQTPDTIDMIDAAFLAKTKKGVRLINVARGGLIVEDDLVAAIDSGHVAGAAIDVFRTEPVDESPLVGHPRIVVTPHLGASTAEAQHRAALTIAQQVESALAGDLPPHVVNEEAASRILA